MADDVGVFGTPIFAKVFRTKIFSPLEETHLFNHRWSDELFLSIRDIAVGLNFLTLFGLARFQGKLCLTSCITDNATRLRQ